MGVLVRLVVLVSLLIFVGWIVGGLYLDRVIKTGIETLGPKITGTPVSLEHVNISLVAGRGRLKGLVIGNPKGFHTKSAYHLVHSTIKFDPTSVLSGKLLIDEIVIDSPEITYEANFSGNNLAKIRNNVEAFGRSRGFNTTAGSDGEGKGSGLWRVQINHFRVKNPQLHVSASIFRGRFLTFDLDDIHLRDIGKESGGVTVDKATAHVLAGTNRRVATSISKEKWAK